MTPSPELPWVYFCCVPGYRNYLAEIFFDLQWYWDLHTENQCVFCFLHKCSFDNSSLKCFRILIAPLSQPLTDLRLPVTQSRVFCSRDGPSHRGTIGKIFRFKWLLDLMSYGWVSQLFLPLICEMELIFECSLLAVFNHLVSLSFSDFACATSESNAVIDFLCLGLWLNKNIQNPHTAVLWSW